MPAPGPGLTARAVPDAELRLITCGGRFDQALGTYLSNIVGYARLAR
jgi:hypothetical protein